MVVLKFSDLVKYDMMKVQKHLATEFKYDAEGLKSALKSYSTNGYKVIQFMAFG
jgi:hypothetical protein